MQEIPLYGPGGKPAWFLKLNPKGTVPVLVCHGGTMRIRDSDEILDTLGDAIPGGSKLVPREKEEKIGMVRSRMSDFLPIGKNAVLGRSKDKMWEKLKELDLLIEGPYICGGEVTIADCAAFPFLWRIEKEFGTLEKKGCRNIKAWLTTCESNKAFAHTIQSSWWWWW
jgi:glutathione S-transferase